MRRKRIVVGAWVAVFASAAALAALIDVAALQLAFAALALVALGTAAVLQVKESSAERSAELHSLLRLDPQPVREVQPHEVGVAPEAPQALRAIGRASGEEYVPRDIDSQLDEALASARDGGGTTLIVVSGPSKAGKTRALYEAMQRWLADGQLIAPATADSIDALVGQPGKLPKPKGSTVVLWLDDVEPFLRVGPEGMHPGVLEQLGAWAPCVVVLATAGGKGVMQAGEEAEQFSVPLAELMRHAREIHLSSELSEPERERLRSYAPQAAPRIARDGIGEYMIAAPDLERKLTSGCHVHGAAPSPHGQAATFAVIDWHRSGITDPIPREALRRAYENYLPDHLDPSDAEFEAGLDWGRQPLYSNVALIEGREAFRAYDHIVSFVEQEGEVDETSWRQFLEAVSNEQAFAMANTAYQRSKNGNENWTAMARRAIEQASRSENPVLAGVSSFNLGVLLDEQGDPEGAETAYRRAAELGNSNAIVNLGTMMHDRGDLDAAKDFFERAEESSDDGVPPLNLGNVLREQNDWKGAEAAYRRASGLGNPRASFNLGLLLKQRDDPQGAEQAYRLGLEQGSSKAAVNLGNMLLEREDLDGAEAAYRRGEQMGDTKSAYNLAFVHIQRGDLEEAEAAYERAHAIGHPGAAEALAELRKLRDS